MKYREGWFYVFPREFVLAVDPEDYATRFAVTVDGVTVPILGDFVIAIAMRRSRIWGGIDLLAMNVARDCAPCRPGEFSHQSPVMELPPRTSVRTNDIIVNDVMDMLGYQPKPAPAFTNTPPTPKPASVYSGPRHLRPGALVRYDGLPKTTVQGLLGADLGGWSEIQGFPDLRFKRDSLVPVGTDADTMIALIENDLGAALPEASAEIIRAKFRSENDHPK